MKSHTCEFDRRDLWGLAWPPLIVAVVFAVTMHLGARFHLLPRPRPTLDIDRTILVHQAEASRLPSEAAVLLIGDSSCLMDVSARTLAERLQTSVLNLGTLSYLDLNAYARMLQEYSAANPGRLRTLVLLMHPESLRRLSPEPFHVELLQNLYAGQDDCPGTSMFDGFGCLLGLHVFKGRLLSRVLPAQLPGAFGRRYGFSADLEAFMARQNGSLIEPGIKPLEGDAQYRLARPLESASRAFKSAMPAGVRLIAGITPVPEGFVSTSFPERRVQMLKEWGQWLEADALLDELPATLPDSLFATPTHLNEAGVEACTELVARALETRWQKK